MAPRLTEKVDQALQFGGRMGAGKRGSPSNNKVCFRFRPLSAASIPTGPYRAEPECSISRKTGQEPGNGRVEGRFGHSLNVMGLSGLSSFWQFPDNVIPL